MNNLEELLNRYGACLKARDWVEESEFKDPAEAWEQCPNPEWLLWAAYKLGVWDDGKVRRFAIYCVSQVAHLFTDPTVISAWETAERYSEGKASVTELSAAWILVSMGHKALLHSPNPAEIFATEAILNAVGSMSLSHAIFTSQDAASVAGAPTKQADKIRELWPNPFKGESENNDKRRVKA